MPQESKKLVLPYPPSANRLWRSVNGVMLKSAEARDYAAGVALLARSKRIKPLDCEVSVRVDIYRPKKAGDFKLTQPFSPKLLYNQGVRRRNQ